MSHIYDIQRQIWKSSQGSRGVTEYWLELNGFWQELDLLNQEEWKCSTDAANKKRSLEIEHILLFLAALEPEFKDVRSRILGQTKLPLIREVYAEIRREESCNHVMSKEQSSSVPEISTLVTKPERPFCDYCKKEGHTRNRCWDIHGKPADWKPRQGNYKVKQVLPENGSAASSQETTSVSNEQLAQIIDMLKGMQVQQKASTSFVQTEPVIGEDDWQC